ncbi:MAG: DNA methylase [Clostridia bacterium]|nr:DNA methylase [Clostridia bacterium]MBR1685315.1 DNA methylase [Clostridia bacterium]
MAAPVYSYICIDLKSYYASVECVARNLDPLKANLLVADESRTDQTICLAVSPSLKAHGVPSRPRLFEAKSAIRDAEAREKMTIEYIIAKPRMQLYLDTSADIYYIYLKHIAAEDIHVYSIDECFIHAAPYLHLYGGDARALAMTLIRDVLEKTGITATVGLGTNLYLAKIAMDIVAKKSPPDKDGVRIAALDEESFKHLLWDHVPITDFWMIAGGTAAKLYAHDMFTMGDIARMSLVNEEMLYRLFGVDAELIIDHAWGMESCTMPLIKSYKSKSSSRSIGQVLTHAYTFSEALTVFTEMADKMAFDLTARGLLSRKFVFYVCYDHESVDRGLYHGPVYLDFYGRMIPPHTVSTVTLLSPTASSRPIREALTERFRQLVPPQMLIRRLGIAAEQVISDDSLWQMDFFSDYERLKEEHDLQHAILKLREKYGPNLIVRGIDFLEGATTRERNGQVGGHSA